MIKKSFEIKNLLKKYNYYLFYGKNDGAKKEEIEKLKFAYKNSTILRYEEKEILGNSENFLSDIYSGSLFEDSKIIIIKHATDKIIKIIEEIKNKSNLNILIILDAGVLEKKSKLRNLFEKENRFICVAFYPDTDEILSRIAYDHLKERKIIISQSNINLIVSRSNGDRGILKNDYRKLNFIQKIKKLQQRRY